MFSSIVVFFFEESQISKNELNGKSRKIREEYGEILKKYDELHYYQEKILLSSLIAKRTLIKIMRGACSTTQGKKIWNLHKKR